eukprot:COSAG01_NODE_12979_length_1654_cov_1.932476_2_plen_189_part_00
MVVVRRWDVGFIKKECTPTLSGFDTFLGYYEACLSDYWYHWAPEGSSLIGPNGAPVFDFQNSSKAGGEAGWPAGTWTNGTYNAHVFTTEAIRLIEANGDAGGMPMYLYLAYQNVHLACGSAPHIASVQSGKKHGLQAPCGTMELYPHQPSDTVKLQGAMVTELDYGVGNVTQALKRRGMWDNTFLFLG